MKLFILDIPKYIVDQWNIVKTIKFSTSAQDWLKQTFAGFFSANPSANLSMRIRLPSLQERTTAIDTIKKIKDLIHLLRLKMV